MFRRADVTRCRAWSTFAALSLELGLAATACAADPAPSPSVGRLSPSATAPAKPARRTRKPAADKEVQLISGSEPAAVPPTNADDEESEQRGRPIDLGSALRLAGVENQQLVIARERVEVAVAIQQLAAAQILPTLNLGMNYDSHTGDLQQSSGNILNLQRSSLYVGAGANAVAAGTVSIPGLQWNLNVSESIFGYLAARQRTQQSQFANQAEQNDVLLQVAGAYTELLRTHARFSLAVITRNDAREVARLTARYAEAGEGRRADAERAATELRRREEDVIQARYEIGQASRRLAEILNLENTVLLRPVESQVVPQSIIPNRIPLAELVAIAMLDRPELKSRQAAIRAALLELGSAKMLPFSPQMMIGISDGVFGGGSNLVASSKPPAVGLNPNQPSFGEFKDRMDIDGILYWSARNMGLGNKALIDAARARSKIADYEEQATLDRVRREVAEAFVRTHIRFKEIKVRAQGVRSGASALSEDLIRVRGREALPIEVLDSLRHLATERGDYLDAIADYNRAQFELYVALGKPPADMLARPIPQDMKQRPTE